MTDATRPTDRTPGSPEPAVGHPAARSVLDDRHHGTTRGDRRPVLGRGPAPTPGWRRSRARWRPGTSSAPPGMFATESFWRDLVSFTWNLTTVENPAGVADLLGATLEQTDPSGFATTEPPTEDDGVVTAWFAFETAVGRGTGLVRLVSEDGEDRAFTFLTTLDELKGHEEPKRDRRPDGRRARCQQAPGHLEGAAPGRGREPGVDHAALRAGHRRRPGRASPSAPGCASSAYRRWSSTSTRDPATSGATATSRCACTTRSGTTTCPTSSSPRTGRSSRPRTRSATGWSPTSR